MVTRPTTQMNSGLAHGTRLSKVRNASQLECLLLLTLEFPLLRLVLVLRAWRFLVLSLPPLEEGLM